MNENSDMQSSLLETQYAAAAIMFGALAFLILVNRGFRGVSMGGFSVGVN